MIAIPSPRSRKRPRIEIIPLIDIIFFLFATFVMVSLSMVKNRGIALNLPAAATASSQSHDTSAVVSITADGEHFFNKQPLSDVELAQALRSFKASTSDPKIIVNGDTEAGFGRVVAVLDEIRTAGIEKISIETRLPPKNP